jgi:hypothetical protein
MAIITKPTIAKGQANEIDLSKSDLAAVSKVVNDSYFSDQTNWSKVAMEYESDTGEQIEMLIFDASQESPKANFEVSEKAKDNWQVKSVIIMDFDGGYLKLGRGDLTVADFDIALGSVGGDASQLIFDFEGFASVNDITDTTGNISTTSFGASLVDDRNGKVLSKMSRNNYLKIPAQDILQGSEFTISMWYKGFKTNDSIFSISSVPRGSNGINRSSGLFSGMAFYVHGTNKQVRFMLVDNNAYQGTNVNVTSPSGITNSTWIKYDITIGNSELKLYQDGQLVTSSIYDPKSLSNILSALNNTADSEIVLLNSVVPNSKEYQNYMDDFKITSRILTDEEILDNYNNEVI